MDKYTNDLLQAAREGNIDAFEHIYQVFKDKIYALSLSTLKNPQDAEDATQQTFIQVYEKLSTLNDLGTFNTWIQRIAINESNMILRKRKGDISIDDDENSALAERIEDEFMLPQEYAEREDLSKRLREIIDELPAVQRQALVLQIYSNLSMAQIAQIMDCSENTVKSRIRYAKAYIKTEIEERERKTGEKFYGIVMLPFGTLFTKLVQSQSMSPAAVTRIWGVVNQHILAAAASAGGAAATGAAAVKTGMTLGAKIAVGTLIGAAVIGGTAFGITRLVNTPPHSADPTEAVTEALSETPTEMLTEVDNSQVRDSGIDAEILSKLIGVYTSPDFGYGRNSLEISDEGKVISVFPPINGSEEQISEFVITDISPLSEYSYRVVYRGPDSDFAFTVYLPGIPMSQITGVNLDGWLVWPEDKAREYLHKRIIVTDTGMLRVNND